jgi:hypothetical protein
MSSPKPSVAGQWQMFLPSLAKELASEDSQDDSQDDKVSTQVRFIREEGKAALINGQGAWKVGSSLLFTEKGFLFGPFCWGGELRVRGGVAF